MKKVSESKIVRVFTGIINVRSWADWDRVKSFTLYLGNGFIGLFVPRKNVESESFDEAVNKLGIDDVNLIKKQNALFRLSMIMLVAAGGIFVYAGYQLFYGSFKAVIVSLIVTMIALVLAFRYHFWYFQIKHRKLGCTFDEWYKGVLGEKNE
jgi:intracellular multiplication protein IcmV